MTLRFLHGWLDETGQRQLRDAILDVARDAPFYTPRMPRSGRPFSVTMTSCGAVGWVSDVDGYRYAARHPVTGRPWPALPEAVLELWRAVAECPADCDSCLVNAYGPGAKMGLHQDRDEETFAAPVVSVSLGDTAVFRVGGTSRRGPTRSVRLASGDVIVFGGEHRLIYHGIDRILAGSSTLLAEGGRLNLTLRRVRPFAPEDRAADTPRPDDEGTARGESLD